MKLSKNFTSEEFTCKCGCGEDNVAPELVRKLQALRDAADFPFTITSGMRCPEYNEEVGGKPSSAHVLGYGVDVSIPDSRSRGRFLEAVYTWFDRVGIGSDFIHVDCDKSKDADVTWVYS